MLSVNPSTILKIPLLDLTKRNALKQFAARIIFVYCVKRKNAPEQEIWCG